MTSTPALPGGRTRPSVHFTAQEGWINDPYGIGWHDGEYHLFYQAVPEQVVWGPNCHWGHATSPDLTHWEEQALALTPEPFELGCWSGSVAYDDASEPQLLYTRVAGDNWAIGQVARATRESSGIPRWRSVSSDAVIPTPPPELSITSYRDPFVFRRDQGDWGMLVGAALSDGTAAALHYHSDDLQVWTYDGVLCSRHTDRGDETWSGTLWECPQLIRLGRDNWVLIVSVWEDDKLHHVVAARGRYDGARFTPDRWQRLTHGQSAYAMTAFRDKNGNACVMSWLREEPRNNERLAGWAGAHSVAALVTLAANGDLVLVPHPDVFALRGPVVAAESSALGRQYLLGDTAVLVEFLAFGTGGLSLLHEDHERLSVSLSDEADMLLIARPGFGKDESLPRPTDGSLVRILLDGDIVEIFSTAGYGAYRIAPVTDASRTTLVFHGPDDLDPVVHPLQAGQPAPTAGPASH